MPKHRRDGSVSNDSFSCSSSKMRSRSVPMNVTVSEGNLKDWEDARCPVCMEHPHNAILLKCSSHEKGCQPFMCDTSYRHSNCLDQFYKAFKDMPILVSRQEETVTEPATNLVEGVNSGAGATAGSLPVETLLGSDCTRSLSGEKPKPPCPLCRGKILDEIIVRPARQFMDAKIRSCACETCDFSGTYYELRKHARAAHPSVIPTEADPDRQRSWRTLERQRDFGDLLSTLHSSFGEVGEEMDEEDILPIDEGGLVTVFLLIRVIQPRSNSRSSSQSGASRAISHHRSRRRLRHWGESYDTEHDNTSSARPIIDGHRSVRRERHWGESYDTENNSPAARPQNDGHQTSRRRARHRGESYDTENNNTPDARSRDSGHESSDGGSVGHWRSQTRRCTTPDNQQ